MKFLNRVNNLESKEKYILEALIQYSDNANRNFTGLEIKKYWNNKFFKLQGNKQNDAIKAGRWSAYAHFNLLVSVQNLLDKHQIKFGSKVWVHPLTNPEIVDELIKREVQISSLDIKKDTLNFDPNKISEALENSKNNKNLPDLIIMNSFAGLGEDIEKLSTISKKYNIPLCIIYLEGGVNFSILENINNLKWGSVILATYDDILMKFINPFLRNMNIKSNSLELRKKYEYLLNFAQTGRFFYLSFFIENRATSIPEYHLKDGQEGAKILLKIYNYIFKNRTVVESFFPKLLDLVLNFTDGILSFNRNANPNIFKSDEEFINALYDNLSLIYNIALPDFVFLKENVELQNLSFLLSEFSSESQVRSKYFHDFFSNQVRTRPVGTIEVPTYYYNRVYLRYFCYSVESRYWQNYFSQYNIYPAFSMPIHPLFKEKEYLKDANFISKYLILL